MPLLLRPYQQQTLPQSGGMPRAHPLPLVGFAGAALLNAGNDLAQLDREMQAGRREADLSDRIGKFTTELTQLELDFDRDQDFKTAPQRFREQAKALQDKHLDGMDDAVLRSAFTKRSNELSLSKYVNVAKDARTKETQYHRAALDTNLDVYADSAATAKNPGELEVVKNEASLALAAAQAAGYVSAEEAVKKERAFLGKVDLATVRRDMTANVSLTADKLALDPEYARNLDPATRASLTDQAYNRADSQRRRLEAESEKDRKKRGDEIMKTAWEMLEKGRLTRDFVANARAFVEPGEYHSLIRGLKEGAGGKNDESALAELNRILYVENDPAKAEAQAFRYQKAGLLKSTTLGTFLGTARTHSRQEGPKTPYERNRAFIVNAIKPSEMVPDPAASARYAQAIREYDDYATATPQATEKDLRGKADDILKRLSIVDMQDLATKTSLGARNDPQRILDEAAGKAARYKTDLEKGRMNRTEFNKKMDELNKTRKAAEAALGTATK